MATFGPENTGNKYNQAKRRTKEQTTAAQLLAEKQHRRIRGDE